MHYGLRFFMAHLSESLLTASLRKIDDCGAFYVMRLVVPSAVKSAVSTEKLAAKSFSKFHNSTKPAQPFRESEMAGEARESIGLDTHHLIL